MANEQNRGTPILSLADIGGVQSTSMLKPEGSSDPGLSSGSESKDLRLSRDASQSADHHSLDGQQASSISAVPDTTIFRQHEVNSPDSADTSSTAHSTLSDAASIHTDNFVFASVSGSDAVNLNDSFASQDVVHSQFGASVPDFSTAATDSPLWSENLLGEHLRQGSLGQNSEFNEGLQTASGGHAHKGDPDGQLWAADDGDTSGNPDGHGSDARLEHMDSDGLANDQVDAYGITSTGAFISVGLDTAAGLYFAEDNNDQFYVGHISTGADITQTTIASTSDEDVTNSFVVDPQTQTIFMDLDGGDYTTDGGDIIKITYQANGTISSPYNPNTFAINLNDVLVDSTSSGGIYQDGRAFALSSDGSTLYYVDDDDDNPTPPGSFTADTNGIYKISTTGDVGQGTAPTPVLLSSQAQFPADDSAGYITGIAINEAQGLIYFTTDATGEGVNTSQDAIWYMPITGGMATKMTLPGGVSLEYASFFSENLAFDPDARTLYVADQEQDHIIQLVLNAGGTGFTSGNNDFYTTDTNNSDGASTYALTWGDLATESSLTGTSTQIVQGSASFTTLLTATPTITNPEGPYIANLAGYTIEVLGGTKGDGTSIGDTSSGTISGAAGLSGDNLYIFNGSTNVQSGTVDGGLVTVTWDNSTQTLTLSGDVSETEYKSLLGDITFQENANTDNTSGAHPTRIIDFIANDGISVLHPSTLDPNEQQITITLNRAPTVVVESGSAVESASTSGTSGTAGTGGLDGDSDLDGDSLTITAVNGNGANVGVATAGTYGSLTLNANGSYTYTASNTSAINSAATGSHPVDTFTYTVSDGHGGLTTQTIDITIDRPPSVVTEGVSVLESAGASGTSGTAGTGGLDGDSDADGDTLTITAVSGSAGNVGAAVAGTYGSLTLDANGSYTYTASNTSAINSAATGSHPIDSFTYTVSDGHGGTTTQTINFSIDRPPAVVTESASVVESASGSGTSGTAGTGGLAGDSDPDGDSLTITAVAGSAGNVGASVAGTYGHLTLNANGSYTYTADNTSAINSAATGSHPVDTFTYTVSDGHGDTTTQTINITIDRPPAVVTESNAVVESASATGTAGTAGTGGLDGDSDKDGDSLTITAVAGSGANVGASVAGTYGHLTLNADGSYTYTADNTSAINSAATGSHPVDSFTYTVSDGHGGTTTQTINITIDRPPAVVTESASAVESASASGTAGIAGTGGLDGDSDADGDTLTITAVAGSGANVGASVAGTYGHLTLNANGSYTYTADNTSAINSAATGSHAVDTFTYTVSDGHGGTTTQTINITIDRPPAVVTESAAVVESASASGTAGIAGTGGLDGDSDPDGDTLTIIAVAGSGANVGASVAGTYGHLTLNADGSYTYSADNTSAINSAATGSHAVDSFTYTVSDGDGGTTTQTINITIDRPPAVVTESGAALESASASGTAGIGGTGGLAGDSDPDGDSLTISAVAGSAGNVGVAVAGTYGSLTLNADGSYTYNASNTSAIDSAATGSHPIDTFTYTVSDGDGGTTTQTINITIDRPPVVVTESGAAVESASASGTAGIGGTGGLAGDSDPDGDSLTITAVGGVAGNVGVAVAGTYGSLTLNADGSYTYNASNTSAIDGAATGSHPIDTFTYTVSDGEGGTITQTINITIDRPPVVVTESNSVVESASDSGTAGIGGTGGLAGDSDPDGDSLTITAVGGVAGNVGVAVAGTYGSLTLNADGSYTYNANNTSAIDGAATGSHPIDTFTYTVSDGDGGTISQTINITIDRAPVVVTESNSVVESASDSGTAGIGGTGGLGGDSDPDGDSLTITAVGGSAGNVGVAVAGTYGSLTLNADGSYTYNATNTAAINGAATGSHPVDSFTYTVSDGQGGTTTQTINISIDRPPVANEYSATDFAGATDSVGAGSGVLSIDSDPDGDSLTVTAVAGSAGNVGTSIAGTYGHLTLNADGSYTYIADNSSAINAQPDNAVLTDTFSYTISDGNGGTSTANLVITVDQAPTVTSLTGSATSSANFSAAHTVTFTLDVGKDVIVAGGTTLSLSDGGTATYVSGSGTQTLIFTYSATDAPGSLSVTGIASGSLADAAGNALAIAGTAVTPYTDAVTDSAANVAANFASLDSAVSNISSITLNDGGTPNLDLTASEIINDQTLIGKIVSSYSLIAKDSAATIGSDFNSLETYAASIAAVVFTDGGTPTLDLTQTQVTNDASLLAKVQGPYDLLVTGVTGHAYTSYQNDYNASDVLTVRTEFNTNSTDTIYGYVKDLTLTGTTNADIFQLRKASAVSVTGGTGDDTFVFGGNFSSSDHIVGGSGNNALILAGNYTGANALTISSSMMSNIQTLHLAPGHSYDITLGADTVTTGQTMTVTAGLLTSLDTLTFDASALTAGTLIVASSAGQADLAGGAGTNRFSLGATFKASDQIDGGTGSTSVLLDGNYSAGVTFNSTTMVNVDYLDLTSGHSYNLTLAGDTVGSGQTLTIEGGTLHSAQSLTIDGSALTTGTLVVDGGAGTDHLTGGAGTNIFNMGAFLTASDEINGGTGTSSVHLDGNYSTTFTSTTMVNVDNLNLAAGHTYHLTMASDTVADGQTLTVQASTLGASNNLNFNGSAVTDGGNFIIDGGAGTNNLTGGAGNDVIRTGNGTDFVTGGAGADSIFAGSGTDTFAYHMVTDSTGPTYDTIDSFNTSGDMIDLLGGLSGVTVVNNAVNTGHLSAATFNSNLAADIGAGQLSAHGAVLFTPSTGALAGETFLIIDENGVAGYQAGQDLVIELTHGIGLASLSVSNFET